MAKRNTTARLISYMNSTPASEGNVLYAKAPRKYEGDDLVKPLRIVDTAIDFEAEKLIVPDMLTIFNTWDRIGMTNHATAGDETKGWSFNAATGQIQSTINSVSTIGFTSLDRYSNYTLEARISSTNGDDDAVGIVLASIKQNGYTYVLSAERSVGGFNATWSVVSSRINETSASRTILVNNSLPISWGGGSFGNDRTEAGYVDNSAPGWAGYPNGVKIKAVRSGSTITLQTTQLDSDVYVSAANITLDLSTLDNGRYNTSAPLGFMAASQASTTFNILDVTLNDSYIYDVRTNEVWMYKNATWVKDTSYSAIAAGRIYYNPNTKKAFYANTTTSVQGLTLSKSDAFTPPPQPDVWIPFVDSLTLLAGSAPNDTVTSNGASLTLPSKSVSFTRASTATYWDKAGNYKFAQIDEPRFEKYGLLLEGQATNYFLYSSDLMQSAWQTGTATKQPVAGPSNLSGAIKYIPTTATGSRAFSQSFQSAIGAYNFSVFLKAAEYTKCIVRVSQSGSSNSQDVKVDLTAKTAVGTYDQTLISTQEYADGWFRVGVTFTMTAATTVLLSVVPCDAAFNTSITGDGTSGLTVWGPQLEDGIRMSSFIPTGATAATRAADICTLQRAGNDNWWGSMTISVEVHCNGMTSSASVNERRGILSLYPSLGEYAVLMLSEASTQVGRPAFAYGNATFNVYPQRIDDGAIHQIVSVSDTVNNKSVVDGGSFSNPTVAVKQIPGSVVAANTYMHIGAGAGATAAGQRCLWGHIRNLRIWHQALPDLKIKGLR